MDVSETIVVYDIKDYRCSQANEYMKLKGQGHSVTFVQGHSDSTFSSFFSLETARLIEDKFHVEPPWDGEWKWVYKCFMPHDQDGRHAHI